MTDEIIKVEEKSYKLDTKKDRFIKLYRAPESGGNISTVCSATGISRQTYYDWLEQDEVFGKVMYDAKMEKCDEMEQQLYQRGYEKSDTALIYWLKNNHPNYKETPRVLQQFNVGKDSDKNTIVFVDFKNGTES
jgi:succinate dehydrogenase flavin-adding protein (antitoxin of CptAB toxin-antitoxin module)